jgi:uncharacterized damage-inducible protein DinB
MRLERLEPWLRGPIAGIDARISPVLYAFEQAREDLAEYTEGLAPEQIWRTPHGLGSVGFHVRHITGSTDRLATYLAGRQLSGDQMAALEHELWPDGPGRDELLAEMERIFAAVEQVIRAIHPGTLADPREVGRRRLPTTVAGLLTHIAEHTQRHVGQAICAARLVRG